MSDLQIQRIDPIPTLADGLERLRAIEGAESTLAIALDKDGNILRIAGFPFPQKIGRHFTREITQLVARINRGEGQH